MKTHTKIYLRAFGYSEHDPNEYRPCEIPRCGKNCVDTNHIIPRGMGGTTKDDVIENLMGMCRGCHIVYGNDPLSMKMMFDVHINFMENNGLIVDYSNIPEKYH